MKRALFLFVIILLVNISYSQEISDPIPVIKQLDDYGNYTIDPGSSTDIGCGVRTLKFKAFYYETLGTTESYIIDEVAYNSKGYLPKKPGINNYYTPAELDLIGGIVSTTIDDHWSDDIIDLSNLHNPFDGTLQDEFNFCFFGEKRTKLQISTNSIVSFAPEPLYGGLGAPYSDYSDWNLRTMGQIRNGGNCGHSTGTPDGFNRDAILQMHDTDPTDPSAAWDTYQFWAIAGDVGERFFILGIHNMPMYRPNKATDPELFATHQMVFYETTNIIEFHIKDKPYSKVWPFVTPGIQAFGFQNKFAGGAGGEGFAITDLDNGDAPIQILSDPSNNPNPGMDIKSSVTYRFIPNGPGGIDPIFTWYSHWSGDPATSTIATELDDPHDVILTVEDVDVPASGLTYTAVLKYEDVCTGEIFYGAKEVKIDLLDPTQMHIIESQFIADDGSIDPDEIDTTADDTVFLCGGDDYTLTANVLDSDPSIPYDIEWGYYNNTITYQILDTTTGIVGDGTTDFFIDSSAFTPPLAPGNNYTFSCTISTSNCIGGFTDEITITVVDENASFIYDKYDFCSSEPNPEPTSNSIFPAPNTTNNNYYFTIDNDGVFVNPHTNADTGEIFSLDGKIDLQGSLPSSSTDVSKSFVITYHAGCPNNTKDQTITITQALMLLNPGGDTTVTPEIPPSPLITQCESSTIPNEAEFDLPAINDYIAQGVTGLNFEWIEVITTNAIDDANSAFSTSSKQVQVTVTYPSTIAPSSCPVVLFFTLSVNSPSITQLTNTTLTPLILCENDINTDASIHTAEFDTSNWNSTILGAQSTGYSVEYTAFIVDPITLVETPYTLPTPFPEVGNVSALPSLKIYAKVLFKIDDDTSCESEVKTFNVEVKNTPIIDALPATDIITKCETDDVEHTAEFNTSTWDSTILGTTQPSTDFHVTYEAVTVATDGTETPFTLPTDSVTGSLLTNITTPDLKIYAKVNYNIDSTITCNSSTNAPVDTGVFYLNVIEKPIAYPLVNIVSDPVSSDDVAIILCETDTTAHTAEFDTTNWNANVLGQTATPPIQTESEYTVEYTYVDNTGAIITTDTLPTSLVLYSQPIKAKTLYEINSTTQCESDEITFMVEVNPSPSIAVPSDAGFAVGDETLEMCQSDTNADGNPVATFDTSNWVGAILGTSQTTSNYHVVLRAEDLNGDVVTLPNPLPASFETPSIIIYATVTDDNIPCDSSEKSFKLVVKEIPTNNDITDITGCESDTINHTAIFDTSNWTSTVIGTQTPDDLVVEYTYNLTDGTPTTVIDGANVISTLPSTIESISQTVSVIIKNTTNTITCFDATPKTFELIVIEEPTIIELTTSTTPDISLTICEDDTETDPNYHTATFDTSNWNETILKDNYDNSVTPPTIDTAYFVEYTYVDTNGNTIITDIDNPLPTNLELKSQRISSIVKYKIDDTTFCESEVKTFDVEVRLIPFISDLIDNTEDTPPSTEKVDLKICEDDTNSNPTVHTAEFDTTYWNKSILKDNYDNSVTPPTINPDYIITYTYVDINGATQTVESTSLPNPFVLTIQTIKYTVKNVTLGEDTCSSEEKEFEVIVDLLPNGDNGNVVVCSGSQNYLNQNTVGDFVSFTFDNFSEPDTDNGNSDENTYKWKATSDNPNVDGESLVYVDSGNIDNPTITDTLINNTQVNQNITYEVIPVSKFGCEGEPFSVNVTVEVAPNITDQNTTICNGSSVNFNLDTDTGTILTNNTYKWHAVENDNVEGETTTEMTDIVIDDTIINTSGANQIVEYIVTPFSSGGCEGVNFSVFVTINPRPDFDLEIEYSICPEDGYVLIGEDSNSDNYIYHWFNANNLNTEIGNTDDPNPKRLKVTEAMLADSNGNYVLTVEDKDSHCVFTQFTSVSVAVQMSFGTIHVSDFNRPENTITVEMSEPGNYEYTLTYVDGNGFNQTITQTSPVFEHLIGSTYQVEVVDLNSCSVTILSGDIYVFDYPHFFTPNNDGDNDTWNIVGSNVLQDAKIYIFDRYGKVLAKVDPNSLGWDGTYEGVQVPASDYWFSIEYLDPNTGKLKSNKGNFSIVRK